ILSKLSRIISFAFEASISSPLPFKRTSFNIYHRNRPSDILCLFPSHFHANCDRKTPMHQYPKIKDVSFSENSDAAFSENKDVGSSRYLSRRKTNILPRENAKLKHIEH